MHLSHCADISCHSYLFYMQVNGQCQNRILICMGSKEKNVGFYSYVHNWHISEVHLIVLRTVYLN